MARKMAFFIFLILFYLGLGAETKVVEIPGLEKPQGIFVDEEQIYITAGCTISILSGKDFRLLKKIGKKGEGPEEFMISPQMDGLYLSVDTKDLFVHSLGKVSWFKKDGTFIRELKLPYPMAFGIRPYGKEFIGTSFTVGAERWRTLTLYDEKLNPSKEIAKILHPYQEGKGFRLLDNNPVHDVYQGRIYLAWENEIHIRVLDSQLKELYSFKHPHEPQKFTKEDENAVWDLLKTNPGTKDILDKLKPIHFPDYYPPLVLLTVTGDRIYCLTFNSDPEKKKFLTLVFDLKGKLLSKVYIPIHWEKPLKAYPITIYNGKSYHITDNGETEEWELLITDIQ